MIKIGKDTYHYHYDSILKAPIGLFQLIVDKQNEAKEEDAFQLLGDTVELITDIPRDVVKIIPIKELVRIFKNGTETNFDKDAKIKNTFLGFEAVGNPSNYDEIDFNELQFSLIKKSQGKNIVPTIAAAVFVHNVMELENEPLMIQRKREFAKEMPLEVLLPYITKYMQTTFDITDENINVIKELAGS